MATPILVLVSGGPAAGKSTLARKLSTVLELPVVSRDLLKAGLGVTSGHVVVPGRRPVVDAAARSRGGVLGQHAFAVLDGVLDLLLDAGVSVIVEQAWVKGMSEVSLAPVVGRSRAVLLHCSTPRAVSWRRFTERAGRAARVGSYPDTEVMEMMETGTFPWRDYEEPMDLSVPTLVVATGDGYAPGLDEIEAFIWRETAAPA